MSSTKSGENEKLAKEAHSLASAKKPEERQPSTWLIAPTMFHRITSSRTTSGPKYKAHYFIFVD
jgi:hypothetical protein